jgi:23S rRNA (cytosine1962-C5)-methyltransferase
MLASSILFPTDWTDYELLDTGEGAKLERMASYTIARPDPRAIWLRSAPKQAWDEADASYARTDPKTGAWDMKRITPEVWRISYDQLTFTLKPTSFKHVGVFPEQAVNWRWIKEKIGKAKPKVLNLFAYTGGATMAAAQAGAQVTHVDAVKSAIAWAKENAAASNLTHAPIRYIEEDAYKFVLREQRRGSTYDALIMDPPRFGRGNKGEVWKIEEDLPKLLAACKTILAPSPVFVLLNAYTADLSPLVLEHLMADFTKDKGGAIEAGELALKETSGGRLLPSGIFARWSAS